MVDESRLPEGPFDQSEGQFESENQLPVSSNKGEFRYAAADVLKAMIYARESAEPGFMSKQAYKRWRIDQKLAGMWRTVDILSLALAKYQNLDERFVGPRSSGGLPLYEDEIGMLRLKVGLFLIGEPVLVIPETIDRIQQEKAVDWKCLCDWGLLPWIRDQLDKLPHPDGRPAYKDEDTSDPHGPVLPQGFLFERVTYEVSPPMVWRLLMALWARTSRGATLSLLAEDVWGDDVDPDQTAAGSLRGHANRFFRNNGLPFRVSVKNNKTAQEILMSVKRTSRQSSSGSK
tara:strand:+ start:145673 stop:146536 length:864 start_codon:yes stop_codon:yes gene_type:complete